MSSCEYAINLLFDDDMYKHVVLDQDFHKKYYTKLIDSLESDETPEGAKKMISHVVEKIGNPFREEIINVPPEILRHLSSTMSLSDVLSLSRTNKSMAESIINSPVFWNERLQKDYKKTASYYPKKQYMKTRKGQEILKTMRDFSRLAAQGRVPDDEEIEFYTFLDHDDVIDYLHANPNRHNSIYNYSLDILNDAIASRKLKALVNRVMKKLGEPSPPYLSLYEE
jgi:hypothetical protein